MTYSSLQKINIIFTEIRKAFSEIKHAVDRRTNKTYSLCIQLPSFIKITYKQGLLKQIEHYSPPSSRSCP